MDVITSKKPIHYISLDEALQFIDKETKENYRNYVNAHLAMLLGLLGFDKSFVKAEGTTVWDCDGNAYLDFLGGYGALNLGHNPQEVLEGMLKVQHRPNILQASMNSITAALARNLAEITPGDLQYTFFSNSGAESVECAIKMAKAATGKSKIVYCKGSFHGKSMGALSVTGREKYRTLFEPLLPNVVSVPFDDGEKLEEVLKDHRTAAFIVEPIQGEGGIIVPREGYLRKVRELCSRYDTLLIIDEVQTGFGRTGKMFACDHENVVPDIMCMAKSLGGGVMPIGATIARKEVWKKAFGSMERCLLHTSTFGGNTLAAAAGIVTIEEIYRHNLIEEARAKGEYLLQKLKRLQRQYPIIKEVRGKGLMLGLVFHDTQTLFKTISKEYLGALVAGELFNHDRIITAYTLNNPNVIRLEPPLIVTYEEIDQVVDALDRICSKHKNFLSFAWKNAKNMLNTVINR